LLLARFAAAVLVCVPYVLVVYLVSVRITSSTLHWQPDAVVAPGLELAAAVVLVGGAALLGATLLQPIANGVAVFMLFGAGLETSFAVLYTELVETGLLDLETLLARMSAGPARAYGLPVPRIAVGEAANLVLLDPQASWRVSEDGFRSRSAVASASVS